MKRDWNEIKEILEAIEEDRFAEYIGKNGEFFDDSMMTPGRKRQKLEELGAERRDIILGHIELLVDAGIIKGIKIDYFTSGSIAGLTKLRPRITMEGYDLLQYLRSSKFRKALTEYCGKIGTELTLDVLKCSIPVILKMLGG
ncbi:MAG: DUF2513 domain-containing protein [Succinivibrio sp.]|jgi:hypothetical protein|nr:DUF2513 domain-containing protein [Succinivibrio sp.]